jgi:hypothetical protein
MHLALSQHSPRDDAPPPFCAGRKLGVVAKALRWTWLHEDPACPSRVLRDKVALTHAPLPVRVRQRNRVRVQWQRNRGKGRPRQADGCRPVDARAEIVHVTPHLACVGGHLLAHGLEQHEFFAPVMARLQHALEAHKSAPPGEDCALLHHREQTL